MKEFMEKIDIRGIPFDNVTMDEALLLVISRLEAGERTAVFTPNAEIAEACFENEETMRTVKFADVILPDGIGIVKAAKILGTPLKEKVPGVEFGERLFSDLANTGHTFFILGGKPASDGVPSVAEDAARKMREKYGTKFAGARDGYFKKEGAGSGAVVDEINSSGADILVVCLGFPAQEKWIENNFSKLGNVKLALALGGSVDVWAERVRRAPKIFINCGLEWLWRLLRQPSRIGRMMKLPKFYLGIKKYKKQLS